MWRDPSVFCLYLTEVKVEDDGLIRFQYPHYKYIDLAFYAGGGRIF